MGRKSTGRVICLETMKIYDSLGEAFKVMFNTKPSGGDIKNLRRHLNFREYNFCYYIEGFDYEEYKNLIDNNIEEIKEKKKMLVLCCTRPIFKLYCKNNKKIFEDFQEEFAREIEYPDGSIRKQYRYYLTD